MRTTLRAALRNQAGCLAGAGLGAVFAAALEAAWTLEAQPPMPFFAAFGVEWGLLAPVACLVGVSAGLVRSALGPGIFGELRGATGDRAALSMALASGPVFALLFVIVSSRFALSVLSSGLSDSAAGAALALGVALFGGIQVLTVVALCKLVSVRPARLPPPLLCFVASLALVTSVLVLAVVSGSTSGAGGPLAMFGVLRREELDLRPVGLISLLLVSGGLFPAPERPARAVAYAVLAAFPLLFTVHASGKGLAEPKLSLAIERNAPLGSRVLGALRRVSDRDRDGFSPRFGGGDCDDRRSGVNPAAVDRPSNGVDEDCSGKDAISAPPAKVTPKPPLDARSEALSKLPERLNVVLLTIDTLRYDLGYMGNPRPVSPRIDELARDSIVFEKAYALASYTAKSLPPMLIGKYSGETQRGYAHFNRFDARETFLAERLSRAGIRTVSVQGHWYFFQNYGMQRGFDVVNSKAAPKAAQLAEGDKSSNSDAVTDAVISELENPELSDAPFFLWAHYTDPHAEYVRHDGFDFGKDSRALYDGEVAFVDREVGRVLDKLRSLPFWERTSVIVTSDHGEAFREHGMIRHGFELWEELVRVPLLIRVPGQMARRVAQRRSLIDIVPTVLELQRVPLPSADVPDFLSGQSLLADLTLPVGVAAADRPIFIDMAEGPHNAERRAFIEGDQKLTLSSGRVLGLFDLARDPEEKQDLSGDAQQTARALERYRAFRQTLREVAVPRR